MGVGRVIVVVSRVLAENRGSGKNTHAALLVLSCSTQDTPFRVGRVESIDGKVGFDSNMVRVLCDP